VALGKLNGAEQTSSPGRILGLDPGLHVTGYALLDIPQRAGQVGVPEARGADAHLPGPALVEAGVIRSAGRTLALRLQSLYEGLSGVLDQFQPGAVVIEELFAHYAHPRTAVLMAHARGVLLLAAAHRRIPCLSYTATQIKKVITGSGRASKNAIQLTMQRELHLSVVPEPPDVADALAAALCHYHLMLRRVS
jgi:crossover junction endodeoxyribonuclease RuvC